jgi:hypothetical protein
MNDDNGQIVSLLTQIRDNQKEAIEMQRAAIASQQSHVRKYYVIVAVAVAAFAWYIFEFLYH